MNNKHHHDSREEGLGDNHNDNDELQHEDTIATLQFPIRQTTRHAPIKNISPSVITALLWEVHRGSR